MPISSTNRVRIPKHQKSASNRSPNTLKSLPILHPLPALVLLPLPALALRLQSKGKTLNDIQHVTLVASIVAYLRQTYPKIDGVWVIVASLACGVFVYQIENPGSSFRDIFVSGMKLGIGAVGAVTLGRYMLRKRDESGKQNNSDPPPSK